jgi:hypothetical protein
MTDPDYFDRRRPAPLFKPSDTPVRKVGRVLLLLACGLVGLVGLVAFLLPPAWLAYAAYVHFFWEPRIARRRAYQQAVYEEWSA